jgi:hypothetical protein
LRLRRRHTLLGFFAAAAVVLRWASASASPQDLTLSFDAEPAEWASVQPGFNCANGSVDQSAPAKSPSAAFVRDDSPGNVRNGKYSARVVLNPGDQSPYSCQKEAVMAIKGGLGEGEGSESWWGWSWKLPVGWRGTDSWGMLFEFTTYAPLWPSYGMLNFDAAETNSLRLGLHTGLTPSPGSDLYDSAFPAAGRSSSCRRIRPCSTTPRTAPLARTPSPASPSREASIAATRPGRTSTGGTG